MQLAFEVRESRGRNGHGVVYEVFDVPGPNPLMDRLIELHDDAAGQMAARFGQRPSRASMSRWRVSGYPVDRNGPRVRLPFIVQLKRVYTSGPALARWFEVIRALGDEIRGAGGVTAWRSSRQKGS